MKPDTFAAKFTAVRDTVRQSLKQLRAVLKEAFRFERTMSMKNLRRKPIRTLVLALISAVLSCSVFGGSLLVLSLRRGLYSYEARLGADILVIPNEARSHGTLEGILLQGIPGYFYTDASCLEKIRAMDGVAAAAPQFYLTSSYASCCSMAVQIVGFDPATDFSIQPWMRDHYSGALRDGDLIVGSDVGVSPGGELTFYNTTCRVAARLDRTGTGMDNAVYVNLRTVKAIIRCAQELGFHEFDKANPDNSVSAVLIRVAKGYGAEAVANDVNRQIRRVQAISSRNMVSNIAEGFHGAARAAGFLTALIWLLAAAILVLSFALISNERKREFAVLRIMGASQQMLYRLLLAESALVSLAGSAAGIVLAALLLFPLRGILREMLKLPYLTPGAGATFLLFLGAVALSVGVGSVTSAVAAWRIGRNDTSLILREST